MSLLTSHPARPERPLTGRTVVVLHAHPDDEAVFTAATTRRLADAGARVVLVTATGGEMGSPRVPLAVGETLVDRRSRELEEAAALLGVSRLVKLGRRDSGLSGWESNAHPDALIGADLRLVSRQVADLVASEGAEAVVTYDGDGIYRHPDHVAVHLLGRVAADLTGATLYQATVDREHLHFAGAHLLDTAAPTSGRPTYGRTTAEITTAVHATDAELDVKRAALLAHASQIGEEMLAEDFRDTYELEWYVRRGPAGLLEELGNAHALV